MNHIKKLQQENVELYNKIQAGLQAIKELEYYLSLNKFRNTDTCINSYVSVADIQLRLQLVKDEL